MASLFCRNRYFYYSLRKLHRHSVAFMSSIQHFASVKDKKEFQGVLTEVMNSLVTSPKFNELPEVGNWIKKVLDYIMTGGKHSRGLCVALAYQMLEDPKHFTESQLHSARILGWCIEMVHAYFLLLDDMLDESITRRGKLCWYRRSHVGYSAMNDALLIQQSVKEIMETKFSEAPFFIDLIKLCNETVLYTVMGEYIGITLTYRKDNKNNLENFTMDRYITCATYKNSYYSIRWPISLALLLVKDGKQKSVNYTHICKELGTFLQLKNDYADVYGDDAVTGKAGTDIQAGKCTWLAVKALELCNETQRSVFKDYYGSKDLEHVQRIKQLYDEVRLPLVYKQHDNKMFKDIGQRINELPSERERQFFMKVLHACNEMQY